jgi:hypothetical protein
VCYNNKFITQFDAFSRDIPYSFLAVDNAIGYLPIDGRFANREALGTKITIHGGVRVNPHFVPGSINDAILVVGGSFAFDDKAADNETWPAILERRLNRRVVNGGVPGYGLLQAVMRAEQLLKRQPYSLVILSIAVDADLSRDRYVNFAGFYRPAIIRDSGKLRQTTVEESTRMVAETASCSHGRLPGLLYWSHIAQRFLLKLGYDGRCPDLVHPKAATDDEILDFIIHRITALPTNKVIVINYARYPFELDVDGVRKIRDAARHHGVPIIDSYDALKATPLFELLQVGETEVVVDLIFREITSIQP